MGYTIRVIRNNTVVNTYSASPNNPPTVQAQVGDTIEIVTTIRNTGDVDLRIWYATFMGNTRVINHMGFADTETYTVFKAGRTYQDLTGTFQVTDAGTYSMSAKAKAIAPDNSVLTAEVPWTLQVVVPKAEFKIDDLLIPVGLFGILVLTVAGIAYVAQRKK